MCYVVVDWVGFVDWMVEYVYDLVEGWFVDWY